MKRGDRGKPRILRYPYATIFVLRKYADGLSLTDIHKALKREFRFMYSGKCPSYDMVRSLIKAYYGESAREGAARVFDFKSKPQAVQP